MRLPDRELKEFDTRHLWHALVRDDHTEIWYIEELYRIETTLGGVDFEILFKQLTHKSQV